MTQQQKYTWQIDTIRHAIRAFPIVGHEMKISVMDASAKKT